MLKRSIILALVFVAAISAVSAADKPVFDVITLGATGHDYTQGSYSLGFRFTANKDLNVTALGFYDDLKNGIVGNHPVGIYDVATQALITTVTVVPTDALNGFFRYHALTTPITLPGGKDYVLQALTLTDRYYYNDDNTSTDFTVDPAITFQATAVYNANNNATALHYPDSDYPGAISDMGPSMLISNPGAPSTDYPTAVLNAGPVAYWRLEAVNSPSEVGTAPTTFQGGATVTAAGGGVPLAGHLSDKALSLDGTSGYAVTGLTSNASFANGATILAWIKVAQKPSTTGATYYIAGRSQVGNDLDLQIQADDSVRFFTDSGSATVYSPSTLDGWHFVAATFDNATQTRAIYWDGQLGTSNTSVPSHSANSSTFTIGNSVVFPGRFFNGLIDEVAAYERALSAAEIHNLYISAGLTNPTVSFFTTDDNPNLLGTPVNFEFSGTDASTLLTYSLDYGDGTSDEGTYVPGTLLTVSHMYSQSGTFSPSISLSNDVGNTSLYLDQDLVVLQPDSSADGIKNVSDNTDPVVNPLNGLTISVASSDGGILQLAVNIDSLTRDAFGVATQFGDVAGRAALVPGMRPVHQYTQHGLYVAKSTATNLTTGMPAGIGRKTLAISSKETGEGVLLGDAPSVVILPKTLTGKFNFKGTKADLVTFNGTIKLPAGLDISQPHEFSIGIGNVIATTMVDGKGKGAANGALKSVKITYLKVKRGTLTKGGEDARVMASISGAGLSSAGFDTEGISRDAVDAQSAKSVARKIQIAMLLDGVPYETLATVAFVLSVKSDLGTISGRSQK